MNLIFRITDKAGEGNPCHDPDTGQFCEGDGANNGMESELAPTHPSKTVKDAHALKPDLATAAQMEYDAWDQDEEGFDCEVGTGGICDRVADAMENVLSADHGIETARGGQAGDDHAYILANLKEGVYSVDIPPGVYETGGGYTWQKIPDVKISPDDVQIDRVDKPMSNEEFYDLYQRWEDRSFRSRAGGGNPCHDPGTGQFCETDGGDGKGEPARVWTGKPVETKTQLSKLETGHLGEKIAQDYLKEEFGAVDTRKLGEGQTNFPVDIAGDSRVIEVKSGLVSNQRTGQQWRSTIGQPGKKERAWLAKQSAATIAKWNAQKSKAIIKRKNDAVKQLEKETGRKLKPMTLGLIIHPDKKTADVYEFDGFHLRIGWNSPQAEEGFVKTVKYK